MIGRANLGLTVPQMTAQECSSWWSLLNPAAWAGGCASYDVSHAYDVVTGTTQTLTPAELNQNPYLQPPPAPQTAAKMVNWSPADIQEALAQKTLQYKTDQAVTRANAQPTPTAPQSTPGSSSLPWLILAGLIVYTAVR